MVDDRTSYSLISAVRDGNLNEVTKLVNAFNLSDSKAWSDGYVLLRDALQNNHTKVAKLLLTNHSKVNSNSKHPSDTPLHFAIKNGDMEIIQMLLYRSANVNAFNKYGTRPLHAAVESKKMEIVKLLINEGADVNVSDRSDETPLHLAIKHGSEEIAMWLLRERADVRTKDRYGETPLHTAIRAGYLEIVEQLLQRGTYGDSKYTNIHQKDYTPLQLAIEHGHEKVVNLLLEYEANIDAQDKDTKTILYCAVEKGHPVIIKHILRRRPDVNNKSNRSALNVAVQGCGERYSMIVQILLQYGFTVHPEDANDSKLLHAAVQKGYLTIVEELFKYGADDDNSTSIKDLMLLHVATKSKREEVAKLLMSYGADVNALDATGNTPIFYATQNADLKMIELLLAGKADVKDNPELLRTAVKQNCREIIEVLLEHGADVNARDATGNTPILYATQNADLKIIELLLARKANVKDNPELLRTAVKQNCREIIEVLLEHGADVNASDKYGETALHCTILNIHGDLSRSCPDKDPNINVKAEIAKLLLSRGANVNARTNAGISILHAASSNGNAKIVEALLEYNVDVNSTCRNDTTSLHFCATEGNEVISKLLLDKGANVNAKQKDGKTALYIATEKGRTKVVEVLLKCGARIDSDPKTGTTLLHVAAEKDYLEIVELLVKFGADIDSENKYGATALHIASKFGKIGIVTALLDHGADVTIMTKSCYCNTALEIAKDGDESFNLTHNTYDSDDDDSFNAGRGRWHSDYESIVEILERHMIKLRTANLYASNPDLLRVDGNLSYFRDECEEEIASMKSEKVDANISFYNILTKGISQLAIYAGNENVARVLSSGDYKKKFPIYASTINTHFRNGERRKKVLQLFHSFSRFLGLPHVCTEKIFNYLSDDDLRALIDACKPISIDNVISSSNV